MNNKKLWKIKWKILTIIQNKKKLKNLKLTIPSIKAKALILIKKLKAQIKQKNLIKLVLKNLEKSKAKIFNRSPYQNRNQKQNYPKIHQPITSIYEAWSNQECYKNVEIKWKLKYKKNKNNNWHLSQ
jgi:hypothetical protein